MSDFVQILTEQVSYLDEAGEHNVRIDVLQDGGTFGDEPIGLTGPITYKMGSKSNAIDKVLNPTQLQFRVMDETALLEKIRGAEERDFKIIVTEDGEVIFYGYLLLESKKRVFYEDVPQVELRAFDGLSFLDSTFIEDYAFDYSVEDPISVKEFLSKIEQAIDIELGWIVYTNFNDPATDRHFPLDYTFKIGHLMRNISEDNRTWGKALELFARDLFGMQVYQWGGKWHVIGRTERVQTPTSITRIDIDTETVSTVDLTGPGLDKSNTNLINGSQNVRPDGEVLKRIAAVNARTVLGGGNLLNEDLNFEDDVIPFWEISGIKKAQTHSGIFDEPPQEAVLFEDFGSDKMVQLSKIVFESSDEYTSRFDVTIELQVETDGAVFDGTEKWSELDMFRLEWVDPEGDLDASVPLNEMVNVQDIDFRTNDTVYGGTSARPLEDKWFDVRLDETPDIAPGQIQQYINVSKTFKIYLPNDLDLPSNTNRRYVRVVIQPNPKPDQHGGDGSKIKSVKLKSFRLESAKRLGTNSQAPDFSVRNDLVSLTKKGETVTLEPSLTNAGDYNGIFVFNALKNSSEGSVSGLGLNSDSFPNITAFNRLAMQALDLEVVNLQTRANIGTNPLQSILFDTTGSETNINIIPVMWRRSLFSGMVDISAVEARYDEEGIETKTTYGNNVDQANNYNTGVSTRSGVTAGITDHGELDGLGDPEDHPWALQIDLSNIENVPDARDVLQVLSEGESDARYIQPNTTPSLDQVVLNNPATADNNALRAGQVLGASAPLSGGGKLRDGLQLTLNSSPTDFKIEGGKLRTAQRIDEAADMLLASLTTGANGLKSDDYVSGFVGGQGYNISQAGDGEMKSLSIRETLLVHELEVRKLRYSKGPHIFGPGGGKIETVTDNGAGSYTLTFPENPGLTIDDFLLIQEFDPDSTLVIRQSRLDVTASNGTSIDVNLLAGVAPQVGDDAAVVASGNADRDSLVYIDPFGPNIDLLDQISDFTDWDNRSPKIRIGLLDGFPNVGGIAPSGYGMYGENVYLKDGHFSGVITIGSGSGLANLDDSGLLATKDFADWAGDITGAGKPSDNADVTSQNEAASISGQGLLATENDLDGVPEGVNYKKVSAGAVTNDGFVFLSETIGTAEDIQEGVTKKFAAESGADVTSNNQASSIAGQGALATIDSADWSTQIGGINKPSDNADVTSQNQAASIAGQGGLATKNQADYGTDVAGVKPPANADNTASNSQGSGWLTDSTTLVKANDSITRLTGRVLDNIADGSVYARVRESGLQDGVFLLSEAIGNIDDIPSGSYYGRIRQTAMSAGLILIREAIGDIDDIADGAGYAKVASAQITANGFVFLSETVGNAGDIDETTLRKWAAEAGADVTGANQSASFAGQGGLATRDSAYWGTQVSGPGKPSDNADVTGNNPQGSDWLTDSTTLVKANESITRLTGRLLDNISDGSVYGRVRKSGLVDGELLLSEAVGVLGDIEDGGGYARIAETSVTAGQVLLKEVVGSLDDIKDNGFQEFTTSTEEFTTSTAQFLPTYARMKSSQLEAGLLVIRGPSGESVIDEGNFLTNSIKSETIDVVDLEALNVKVLSDTQSVEITGSHNNQATDGSVTRNVEVLIDGQTWLLTAVKPSDSTPPNEVGDLVVNGYVSSRTLSWTGVSDAGSPATGVDHYNVYRRVDSLPWYNVGTKTQLGVGSNHIFDDDYDYSTYSRGNHTIAYRVDAVDGAGNIAGSSNSDESAGNVDSISIYSEGSGVGLEDS